MQTATEQELINLLATCEPASVALAQQIAQAQQIDLDALIVATYPRLGLRTATDFLNLQTANFSWAALINLQIIRNFVPIQTLNLNDNILQSLEGIENLTNLVEIQLSDNRLQHLWGIENLKKLEHLYLNNNNINDLSPLQNLQMLKSLSCLHNPIQSLAPLYGLSQLQVLFVSSPQISQKEVDILQSKLPNCKIYLDDSTPMPNVPC